MSARDHPGERDTVDGVYPPGERYQPILQPFDWRNAITAVVVAAAVHYLPHWASGALLAAFGLFFVLRAAAAKAFRRGDMVGGAALVLLGGLLASGLTGAGR